jgi:hypothetical protein
VVAAFFADDPALAHAAHAVSCAKLRRFQRRFARATPIFGTDDLSLLI